MDTEDGSYPLEMQAKRVVDNMLKYNGAHPCPQCGLIMSPVAAMYSKGLCPECYAQHNAKRLKNRRA